MIDLDRRRVFGRQLIERLSTPTDAGPYASDGVRSALTAGLAAVALLVFGGGLWATTATLSGAVLASGTVVVDSNVKKVQHATGGTVGRILVRDGDKVEQGALLIKLDETIALANLQIVTKQLDELSVRRIRLIAEQEGAESLAHPAAIEGRNGEPEMAARLSAERKLFESRRTARQGQQAQLRERIAQLRQQADGVAAQQWAKGREIDLVGNELEGADKLWAKKLIPIAKFTALQRVLRGNAPSLEPSTPKPKDGFPKSSCRSSSSTRTCAQKRRRNCAR